MDRCKQVSSYCINPALFCPETGMCTIDWPLWNQCENDAPEKACDDLMNGIAAKYDPNSTPPPPSMTSRGAYQRCEGLYPWMIYKNLGNGSFSSTASIKYMPVPLESDGGDSNIIGPAFVGQRKGIFDFDGDGVLDAVERYDGTLWSWHVWLGDGTGGVQPTRYKIVTPPANSNGGNLISGIGTTHGSTSKSSEGLIDINGDGLSEHWLANGDIFAGPGLNANVAYHTGTGYQLWGGIRW
jgi:hypothetical protein